MEILRAIDNMPGPMFLLVYGAFVAATIALAALAQRLRDPTRNLAPPLVLRPVSETEAFPRIPKADAADPLGLGEGFSGLFFQYQVWPFKSLEALR